MKWSNKRPETLTIKIYSRSVSTVGYTMQATPGAKELHVVVLVKHL